MQGGKPLPFKNVFDEFVEMINLIKSKPLSTCLINILHYKMGSMYEALLLHIEQRTVDTSPSFELQLSSIFHGTPFLFERVSSRQNITQT